MSTSTRSDWNPWKEQGVCWYASSNLNTNGYPMRAHRHLSAIVTLTLSALLAPSASAQETESDPVMLSAGTGMMEWRAFNGALMFSTPAPVNEGVIVVDGSSSVAWVLSGNSIVRVSTNRPFEAELVTSLDSTSIFPDGMTLMHGLPSPDDISLVDGGAALCMSLHDGPPNIVTISATVRVDLNTGAVASKVTRYLEPDDGGDETPAPCEVARTRRTSPYPTPVMRFDEGTCSVVLEATGRTIAVTSEHLPCELSQLGHSYRRGFSAVGLFVGMGDYGWQDLYFVDHSVGRLVTVEPLRITTEQPLQWHWMNDLVIVGERVIVLAPGPSVATVPMGAAWLH